MTFQGSTIISQRTAEASASLCWWGDSEGVQRLPRVVELWCPPNLPFLAGKMMFSGSGQAVWRGEEQCIWAKALVKPTLSPCSSTEPRKSKKWKKVWKPNCTVAGAWEILSLKRNQSSLLCGSESCGRSLGFLDLHIHHCHNAYLFLPMKMQLSNSVLWDVSTFDSPVSLFIQNFVQMQEQCSVVSGARVDGRGGRGARGGWGVGEVHWKRCWRKISAYWTLKLNVMLSAGNFGASCLFDDLRLVDLSFSPFLLFHQFKPEMWSVVIRKTVWSLLRKDDADIVATYKLFVCCFAWNLDKLATEAEKAQPVLSDIIGAVCLYTCLAEQHQTTFDMVLSQGHSLVCTAVFQWNHVYIYTHTYTCYLVYNTSGWFARICKIFFHLPYLLFSFHINKPLWKNCSIFPKILSLC